MGWALQNKDQDTQTAFLMPCPDGVCEELIEHAQGGHIGKWEDRLKQEGVDLKQGQGGDVELRLVHLETVM
jgi:hypothetical protein